MKDIRQIIKHNLGEKSECNSPPTHSKPHIAKLWILFWFFLTKKRKSQEKEDT